MSFGTNRQLALCASTQTDQPKPGRITRGGGCCIANANSINPTLSPQPSRPHAHPWIAMGAVAAWPTLPHNPAPTHPSTHTPTHPSTPSCAGGSLRGAAVWSGPGHAPAALPQVKNNSSSDWLAVALPGWRLLVPVAGTLQQAAGRGKFEGMPAAVR